MSSFSNGPRPAWAWIGALAVALSACSSANATDATASFAATPFDVLTSAGGLHVEARSAPEAQPARGVNSVELAVSDPTGAPRDGLGVDVVPWMSAMGHGASVKPSARAVGGGRYVLSDVDFFMPGRWELRITFTSGAADDHATLVIPIS